MAQMFPNSFVSVTANSSPNAWHHETSNHAAPQTRTWTGGPRQKIGSVGESLRARALRMSLALSITEAATNVYSPGTRKYKENECLICCSGGTSKIIPFKAPKQFGTWKMNQHNRSQEHLLWSLPGTQRNILLLLPKKRGGGAGFRPQKDSAFGH